MTQDALIDFRLLYTKKVLRSQPKTNTKMYCFGTSLKEPLIKKSST